MVSPQETGTIALETGQEEPVEAVAPVEAEAEAESPQGAEPEPTFEPALPQPSARERQLAQELNQATQRLQAVEQENQRRTQAATEQQYIDAIESGDYTAQQIAQIVRHMHKRAVDAESNAQNTQKETEAKLYTATQMGQRYGVPMESLMRYNTPEAMEDGAKAAQELSKLKSQVDKMQKGTIPSQRFDTGRGKGGPAITGDNVDLLHMQGQISDEAYRDFLSTGKLP